MYLFTELTELLFFTFFKKKKKLLNLIIFLSLKKNLNHLGNHIFFLDFFFRTCFFLKNVIISYFNVIILTEMYSRKNEYIFFRNNRTKILNTTFLYLVKKKKIKITKINFFKKKTSNQHLLCYKILPDSNSRHNFESKNLSSEKIYNNLEKILNFLNKTNFLKKFSKMILLNFFCHKISNLKFRINVKRDKFLFEFFTTLDISNYFYQYFKENNIDSLLNSKIFNKNQIIKYFHLCYKVKKQSVNNRNKKNKVDIFNDTYHIFYFKNISKIPFCIRYLLLNFEIYKLILGNFILILKKDLTTLFNFFIIILFSSKTVFNNFILLCIFKLINSKSLKSILLVEFTYLLFSKIILEEYKNVNGISKYSTIVIFFSIKWFKNNKKILTSCFLFTKFSKIIQSLIYLNNKKFVILTKIFLYLNLSNFTGNKNYLKRDNIKKKKKSFFFIKCNKCILIMLENFFVSTYNNFHLKQKAFLLFKSSLFFNMTKHRYNYKVIKLQCLLIKKIACKNIKTQNIENLKKIFLKMTLSVIKNLTVNSKFYLKKFINWIWKKLETTYSFIFILFLIDNSTFFKFIGKHIKFKTFFFFEKIILNKKQRISTLIFLEKISVFLGSQETILYSKDFSRIFLTIHSNLCTLLGPNRSHILKKNSIGLVQKKIDKINFLRAINDLNRIISMGNLSRFINLYSIKNFYFKKKKKKNECFQSRECYENFFFTTANIFCIKYFFFSFKFFLYDNLLSFKEIFDKFFYLSFFVLNHYINKDIVEFFNQIIQNGSKKACIIFQNGINLIFQYGFTIIDFVSEKEKIPKNKFLMMNKSWSIRFCRILLNNQKSRFNYFILKFFLIRLLVDNFFKKKKYINQEIIVFFSVFLSFFKKNNNNYKHFTRICEKIQRYVEMTIKKKIKKIIKKKCRKSGFFKWILVCNLLIVKIFFNFFQKYETNFMIKNPPVYFKQILDISELTFVFGTNWIKKVQNLIKFTKIF
nr:hypothetical protein CcurKRNrm1_p043 [Cryptomonas curvata]